MQKGELPAFSVLGARPLFGTMNLGLRVGTQLQQGPGARLPPARGVGGRLRFKAFRAPGCQLSRHLVLGGPGSAEVSGGKLPGELFHTVHGRSPRRLSCSDGPAPFPLALRLLFSLLQKTSGQEREAPRGLSALPESGEQRGEGEKGKCLCTGVSEGPHLCLHTASIP